MKKYKHFDEEGVEHLKSLWEEHGILDFMECPICNPVVDIEDLTDKEIARIIKIIEMEENGYEPAILLEFDSEETICEMRQTRIYTHDLYVYKTLIDHNVIRRREELDEIIREQKDINPKVFNNILDDLDKAVRQSMGIDKRG